MSTRNPDDELMMLIDRVAAREERALQELYERVSSRLYGLALKVVRERNLAEDVLQEAFVTIWRSAGSYRAALSPPLAWMGLIVRSRALDALRRRTAERADVTDAFDDTHAEQMHAEEASPQDAAEASQQAVVLHQCLGRLEQRQREVVSLAYLRDLSHGELSEQLKLPLGTVKSWIRRGLEQLRQCMARYA